MARTVRDKKLDARSARLKLAPRREPYWRSISQGLAVGYRHGRKGGTWIARHYTPETRRRFKSLGTADDVVNADGVNVLDFVQAQERAREWFTELARQDAGEVVGGTYTVANAMADYIRDYKRRGGKALERTQYIIDAHINPALGDIEVSKLNRRLIENWVDGCVETPPRLRTRKGEEQKYRDPQNDDDALRRRKSTANRILTVLKAGLNHALLARRVANNDAWASVKPFREVDMPKVRYLTDDEARRLVNACPPDLRALVTAALLTGARYSELARLRCSDFNPDSGTIHVVQSKGGKARHVVLTEEGQKFFAGAIAGRPGDALIFTRSSGGTWKHADQYRPLKQACEAAQIKPTIGFHILRHTYGSRLAMRDVPMVVIAGQLGHGDTRMAEKHYVHLAPSYVADTVRAAFDNMGLVEDSNVTPLRQ